MRVLVTGGCGYKGAVLVPKLLAMGHAVTVLDTQWFGVNLRNHQKLEVIKGDTREIGPYSDWLKGFDTVIHLAAIANDPCGDLDAKLTWEVNVLATTRLADACARCDVSQFIFASSASIYGIKDNVAVKEDTSFEPVSDYNKTKMVAERALMSYAHKFNLQIVRPATVCGVSPRMRLDVIVNLLTVQALEQGAITAHCGRLGGSLMRPHTHIEDVTDLYCWLVGRYDVSGAYNAGFENLSVGQLADRIAEFIPTKVKFTEVADKRSYAVDSSRLLELGYSPRHSVSDAITDIMNAWHAGAIKRDERSINLEWMRKIGVAS